MEIEIKRADTNDAPLISKLSTVTFLDTFTGTCTHEDIQQFVSNCFNIQQVCKELEDPFDFYFIGFLNNQAVGYLRMKEDSIDLPEINKYKSIELKRIYVVKEYHDKKIGAALMKFVLQFAAKNKYEAVWLGVWEHNEKAKAFYKKWGFTDTGVTHDFPIGNTPQTDHWFMKLI